MEKFVTINRPKNMDLALIENLGFIGPASCIPFDEEAISDQCMEDIEVVRGHREKYENLLAGLERAFTVATSNMQKQIGYSSGALSKIIGENLATKIANRNIYFINYVYAQMTDYGRCGQLTSKVFFNYVAELYKSTRKVPKLQIVKVVGDTAPDVKAFRKSKSRINDHSFFVVGGDLPVGEAMVDINTTKPIPEKYLTGWVCDLWNKDLVSGPVSEVAKSNKIYDLSKWKKVTILDVSDPYFSGSGRNYNLPPDTSLSHYDYFLNPQLFLDMMEMDVRLKEGFDMAKVKKAIELPDRIKKDTEKNKVDSNRPSGHTGL
ncbi:hypothetical protein NBZ79_01010 [Sneathiella marina]|uniref:Uncharacterized protein n=1 Tax=Sneathiella marina TaxID=2950108 RepID=A0ABY4W728_9PROT|nr:hypothetical protein [Sneathiella marina]USG61555.1 hypothetical protein NBZ79_01010 [Sneathiella marina]